MSAAKRHQTPANLEAVRVSTETDRTDPDAATIGAVRAARRKPRSKRAAAEPAAAKPARTTKNATLITLLSAECGADVAALSAALGWLPHTTRAALTRLRQAGYELEASAPPEGGAKRYRIIASPQPEARA